MIFQADLAIKRYGSELGAHSVFFRSIAQEIDQDSDRIFQYINHPGVELLYSIRTLDAEQFFLLYEALAYGDIGVLFAAPRTCLSGILLLFIGSEEHRNYYFDYLKKNKIRSFFAVTEPKYGSDMTKIETKFDLNLSNQHVVVSGEKILVGNLGIANIGVVVGRVGQSPIGICAALIKPEDFLSNQSTVQRETLPLFGLKSSLLGKAEFSGFVLPREQLLGQHLNVMERGLQAVIKTFNIMRLGISGFALGHAQAALDYITTQRRNFSMREIGEIEAWQAEINAVRSLAILAARKNQNDRIDSSRISLVKTRASQLAEKISVGTVRYFGFSCIAEHPFVVKSLRDCFGYEYMDGTTNIQRKNIYQGYLGGRLEINFS